MGAILDLIGSYIFKAAMIGIILATSISLNGVMTRKAQLTNLEKSMNVSLSVIDWDFRNAGYSVGAGSKFASLPAPSNYAVKFYGDMDNSGGVDSVQWTISDEWVTIADSLVKRFNVARRLNNQSNYVVLKRVRHWDMKYLNASGSVTTIPSDIRAVLVKVVVESPFVVDGEILTATRQITVFPPNLAF